MRVHQFQSELLLPAKIDEVFSFFSDAGNLDDLTPDWLHFKIVTPRPIELHAGSLIDYKLRVRGFPIRWRTRINVWEPPYRFVDEELRGPYRQWVHEHTFETRDGGTLVRDKVSYAVPFDWLAHRLFVRPDVEKIFRFRADTLRQRFLG
jgi:ligand-binding SRPBCC domain-containing protein